MLFSEFYIFDLSFNNLLIAIGMQFFWIHNLSPTKRLHTIFEIEKSSPLKLGTKKLNIIFTKFLLIHSFANKKRNY